MVRILQLFEVGFFLAIGWTVGNALLEIAIRFWIMKNDDSLDRS